MLNKKITTKRSTLLILSMCCTVPSIRTIEIKPLLIGLYFASQPATALIVCRQLSLLHMTMPAIVSTLIGIFIALVTLYKLDSQLTIKEILQVSLILLSITIIVCALIAYLTTFDLTLVVPIINMISLLLLWCRNGDSNSVCRSGLSLIVLLLFIIAFNYIGFYIGQLI